MMSAAAIEPVTPPARGDRRRRHSRQPNDSDGGDSGGDGSSGWDSPGSGSFTTAAALLPPQGKWLDPALPAGENSFGWAAVLLARDHPNYGPSVAIFKAAAGDDWLLPLAPFRPVRYRHAAATVPFPQIRDLLRAHTYSIGGCQLG